VKVIERFVEMMIFNSRWILAPFYLGLIVGIAMLLVKFTQEFIHTLPALLTLSGHEMTLTILSLVDMSLIANLLIIIIFSGYENFVSKINTEGHEDRPEWMGKVNFSGLKMQLIASMVAISGIELLKSFVNVAATSDRELSWRLGIHGLLVVSGVLFATMDRIAHGPGKHS
jgi:uncharacterized protein (TIGR00645 family)